MLLAPKGLSINLSSHTAYNISTYNVYRNKNFSESLPHRKKKIFFFYWELVDTTRKGSQITYTKCPKSI